MSRARDLAGIFNLNPLSGTTAQRPTTAEVGDIYYNGTIGKTQIYTPTGWQDMASGIPFGNNAARPSSPSIGQPYFNGESQRLELYTGAQYGWQNIVAETPGVTGYTGTIYESSLTNTITITGTNFALGASVTLVGQDGTEYAATGVTVNNLTSITATFGSISASKEPYDIKVTNPSNLYGVYYDIVTVNDAPIWVTAAGSLGTFNEGSSVSIQLSSTDEESDSISYSLYSGSLPLGLTISSSGLISGTLSNISADTTSSFTIKATSSTYNESTRAFSMIVKDVLSAEILVVAGGGGGGYHSGSGSNGGGGAGGLAYASAFSFLPGSSSYTVTVGAGGRGGVLADQGGNSAGRNGSNSMFGSITSIGGGGGGGGQSQITPNHSGYSGGSGGGAAGDPNAISGTATQTSGSGYVGFGFNGGLGTSNGTNYVGGGGGGAGGVGGAGTIVSNTESGGAGGLGKQYSISGTSEYYAAGGGGATYTNGSVPTRASGIGGRGTVGQTETKVSNSEIDAIANTGSGGGAARWTTIDRAGNGSDGVVIIAYPDTYPALTIPGTLTYTQPTRSGYRVYKFTAGTGTVSVTY